MVTMYNNFFKKLVKILNLSYFEYLTNIFCNTKIINFQIIILVSLSTFCARWCHMIFPVCDYFVHTDFWVDIFLSSDCLQSEQFSFHRNNCLPFLLHYILIILSGKFSFFVTQLTLTCLCKHFVDCLSPRS